jgi:hypothetical protein
MTVQAADEAFEEHGSWLWRLLLHRADLSEALSA